MKKYILSLSAVVLFVCVSHAQTGQQAVKTTKVASISKIPVKPTANTTTAKVTPANHAAKKQTTSTTAIKRKHRHKKKTSQQKTGNK